MEQGKFAYRKNLENARKAVLDRGDTAFKTATASQTAEKAKEGLMRPRARPEPTGGSAGGFGLALLESFAQRADEEESTTNAMSSSPLIRPKSRPDTEGFGTFKERMRQSESSGNSSTQITLDDGRTMTGSFQFGDARLADYKKASGSSFTTSEFRDSPELQETVMDWHIADIDKTIDSLDTRNLSRDGLRAVAHLGGSPGMKKYVNSGGKYNPSDEFGTSLSDYYNKFKTQ